MKKIISLVSFLILSVFSIHESSAGDGYITIKQDKAINKVCTKVTNVIDANGGIQSKSGISLMLRIANYTKKYSNSPYGSPDYTKYRILKHLEGCIQGYYESEPVDGLLNDLLNEDNGSSYGVEQQKGINSQINTLYLNKNGRKIIITLSKEGHEFYDIKIVDNTYLVYSSQLLQTTATYIYNVQTEKHIGQLNSANGLSSSMEHIYSCAKSGYGRGYVQSFNFKTGIYKSFVENGLEATECEYRNGILYFTLKKTLDVANQRWIDEKYKYVIEKDTLYVDGDRYEQQGWVKAKTILLGTSAYITQNPPHLNSTPKRNF